MEGQAEQNRCLQAGSAHNQDWASTCGHGLLGYSRLSASQPAQSAQEGQHSGKQYQLTMLYAEVKQSTSLALVHLLPQALPALLRVALGHAAPSCCA